MTAPTKLHSRRKRRLGFTAIELTAVASIIALLALILVPILRGRLANARFTATQDDMRSIEIAQMLANAENSAFFRLSDLDNPQNEIPMALWNIPLDPVNDINIFTAFAESWNGPYITYNNTRFITLAQLTVGWPELVRVNGGPGNGPILVLQQGVVDPITLLPRDELGQRHPIDAWNAPFIFFAPEPFGPLAGNIAIGQESNFSVAVVYSLGPNRRAGDLLNPTAVHYFRESGVLGTGDDLTRIF
jgi:type II secretory pathway pseudopilin PulG